jgi:GT2 family glycosyltransferase
MSVTVITPWKDHAELIADYEAAVRGAQVITIDNASAAGTAAQLRAMTERLHGLYLRNDVNAGFAAANNQGLARATGEIVLFLNNDVAAGPEFLDAVRRDTAEGILIGPSLQRQFIYGFGVPYLEGWCIAGRRSTWQKVGQWDAQAFTRPYWEDSELCLRAMEKGVCLKQAAWPVQHKQNQTAGCLVCWGDVYEHNRAIFAARVRSIYERMCSE